MSYRGNYGTIVEVSRVGAEELTVEWQMNGVLSLPGGSGVCYQSPLFRIGNADWYFNLWPKWMNESWNRASGWLRLRLVGFVVRSPKTFHARVGIKGSSGVEKESEVVKEFSIFDHCDWDNFCSRFVLIEHKSRLTVGGRLTITCVIKMVAPSKDGGNGESFRKRKFLESGGVASGFRIKLQGKEAALEDFGKLLASGEDSDVTVRVGGVEFRVHRLILSARSPVFSAMFRHETAERASNEITVEGCEPEAFKEYLEYLYTGSVQLPSPQNVFGLYQRPLSSGRCLYQVADRYLADDLKQQCLRRIQEGLSVRTFCDAVQLALVHAESGLLERAVAFAAENIYLNSFYFKQNLLE